MKRTSAALIGFCLLLGSVARPALAEESWSERISFSGYGDIHYNNPAIGTMKQSALSEADVHRLVLGWAYEFTPQIRVDVEVDFEHAAKEIELELAHLDYDLTPNLTFRAGSLLMPVGPLNEFHEPPLYYSVERPYVEKYIVPTTWQEIGMGLVGRSKSGALAYRGYVVTGLDALGFTGLEGLDGGISHGSEGKAEDLAGVARVEYAAASGLSIGLSGYYGGADQGDSTLKKVFVAIGGADARYRGHGWDVRGAAYGVTVDGAGRVSSATGQGIGKTMIGWYGEVAYDLLRRDAREGGGRSLMVFGRFEDFDTMNEVPSGLVSDPSAARRVITAGLSYLPIEKIAFKGDFEHWKDDTDAQLNRFNLGLAFRF
ncbi:MAG TPA: hypothetical protein VJQ53_06025 [Candidatus Eisenbacteria bacterium]|nr:hypothetical protein [Candidatus Eisenbacteria bacterium]